MTTTNKRLGKTAAQLWTPLLGIAVAFMFVLVHGTDLMAKPQRTKLTISNAPDNPGEQWSNGTQEDILVLSANLERSKPKSFTIKHLVFVCHRNAGGGFWDFGALKHVDLYVNLQDGGFSDPNTVKIGTSSVVFGLLFFPNTDIQFPSGVNKIRVFLKLQGFRVNLLLGNEHFRFSLKRLGVFVKPRFKVRVVGHASGGQVRIDLVAPDAPMITSPVDGAIITDSQFPITGTAEPSSLTSVYDNGILTGTTMADPDTGAFTFTPATPYSSGTHVFTFTATDLAGNVSNVYGPITVIIGLVPVAPTDLAATGVSSSQINLTWTDNSSDEDGFRIERTSSFSEAFAELATVPPNTQSFQDTALYSATMYIYRVVAYNDSGERSGEQDYAFTHSPPIVKPFQFMAAIDYFSSTSEISDPNLYLTLVNLVQQYDFYLSQQDYSNALNSINSIIAAINQRMFIGIQYDAANVLLHYFGIAKNQATFLSKLPANYDVYLLSQVMNDPVIVTLADGSVVKTYIGGCRTIRIGKPDSSGIAPITVLSLEAIGTPFTVGQVDFGQVKISLNQSNPGSGTLNINTGEITLADRVLFTTGYINSLGYAPIELELNEKGVLFPLYMDSSCGTILNKHGKGIVPIGVPILGGAEVTACPSQQKKGGERDICPYAIGDHQKKVRAKDKGGETIVEYLTGGLHAIEATYGVKACGTYWVAACIFSGGLNNDWVFMNDNGLICGYQWNNWDNDLNKTGDELRDADDDEDGYHDQYWYIMEYVNGRKVLTVIHEEAPHGATSESDWVETGRRVLDPPPTEKIDLKGICDKLNEDANAQHPKEKQSDAPRANEIVLEQSQVHWFQNKHVGCLRYRGIRLAIDSYTSTDWDYSIALGPKTPWKVYPGDEIRIEGKDILSAGTSGNAQHTLYGAWTVKSVTTEYVIFQATASAIVVGGISGFSLHSEESIVGLVNYGIRGNKMSNYEYVLGPISRK